MMKSRILLMLLAVVVVVGCGDDDAPPDAGFPYPAWNRGLPQSSVMGVRRGLYPARGIIHLHSPYSHDACDGEPKNTDDGTVKEDCLADLRAGLCTTQMDFAALTDHDDSMADADWPDLFLARGDDQLLTDQVTMQPFASRMICPDGGQMILFVGGENDLMPLMMDDHPPGTVADRHAVYNGNDVAAVGNFRAAGGLAWVAHSESKDLVLLRDLKLDGMEVFNLHAAIDPDIRRDWLMLDASEAIERVLEFADSSIQPQPEPDLAILSFLAENQPSVQRWHALLSEGNRITGSAGTDAHQNALPLLLSDGERGDSYRRMMRWFSNVVLVADANDPRAIEQALAQGRVFIAFEILGTPEGFDARATTSDGMTHELGAELRVSDGVTITVDTPKIYGLDERLPVPTITTRILRVDSGAATEVGVGDRQVSALISQPGAYRVEVRIVPKHLGPYLRGLAATRPYADEEYVWIYASPIYVRP